jgi:hypothetical protein
MCIHLVLSCTNVDSSLVCSQIRIWFHDLAFHERHLAIRPSLTPLRWPHKRPQLIRRCSTHTKREGIARNKGEGISSSARNRHSFWNKRPTRHSQNATILSIWINGPFPKTRDIQISSPSCLPHLYPRPSNHSSVVRT